MNNNHFVPVGEERAFVVRRFRRKMAYLVVILSRAKPQSHEVLALKRVVPEFADASSVNLHARMARPSPRLGPYLYRQALELLERLKLEGLRVEVDPYIHDRALLIDERGPAAWLIEDERENVRVIEDAIRRGVREEIHDEGA